MIDIDTITIGEARRITTLIGVAPASPEKHPYNIGANYFIRTVTHHHTGTLVAVTEQELVLKNAAWIADDGRLQQALETGNFNEVEMFPSSRNVIVGRAAIIDAVEIDTVPKSQK